jgi:hypothetical protein
MVTTIIIFLILLGVVILGKVLRAPLIVILAGFGFMVFGPTLWVLYWWLSVIFVIVGLVVVAQGFRT